MIRASVGLVLAAALVGEFETASAAPACNATPSNNCIVNGDFEAGSLAGWNFAASCALGNGTVVDPCAGVLAPQAANGCTSAGACCTVWSHCSCSFPAVPCGNFAAMIFSGEPPTCPAVAWGELYQDVWLPPGGAMLDFQYAYSDDTLCSAWGEIEVQILGGSGCSASSVFFQNLTGCVQWTQGTVNLCQYGNCQIRLRIRASAPASTACGFAYLDQVNCVPCVTTFTPSRTATATSTSTSTSTVTATATVTATITETHTVTATVTVTDTQVSPTNTSTATVTPTITATFTPTRTATVTETHTPSFTVTPDIVAEIRIYNTAGELVRTLNQRVDGRTLGVFLRAPEDVKVEPNPFSPDGDGKDDVAFVVFPDDQRLSWDGTSERGEVVSNGAYWMRVTLRESLGVVAARFDRKINVLAEGNLLRIRIRDTSGHVVKSFPDLRAPAAVEDFAIRPDRFTPGFRNGAYQVTEFRLQVAGTVGGVPLPEPPAVALTVPWNGSDDAGNMVRSGTYWVHVTNVSPGGTRADIVKSLVVVMGHFRILENLMVYPNPWTASDEIPLYFSYTTRVSDIPTRARIYDIQGRLVADLESRPHGEPDPLRAGSFPNAYRIRWNGLTFEKLQASDGVYTAVISAEESAEGLKDDAFIKFAILKRTGE